MHEALEFALETARRAGDLLRHFARNSLNVRSKSTAIDLVTEADLASERLIIEAIRERFPRHAILSEEGQGDLPPTIEQAAILWLVDPLDGTVNYAHGYPVWGVSLALATEGRVVMGVILDPLRDEMYWASRGQGAWLNGRPIRVSGTARLQDALVATGFPYQRATVADNNLAEFNRMMPRVQGVRRAGAAVLDLAHVAAGRLDGYWERYLKPWDWAAASLLVEEAGGVVTDMAGGPWTLSQNTLAASNGPLHDPLLAVLKEAGESPKLSSADDNPRRAR